MELVEQSGLILQNQLYETMESCHCAISSPVYLFMIGSYFRRMTSSRKHCERCLIHVFIIPNSVNLPAEMNTPKGEVESHKKVILSVTQLTYSAHKKQVKPQNTFLFPQPFHLYDIS